MKLHRNEHGLLRGDLEYDVGFAATVLPHIAPIVFPCAQCGDITFHVVIEQPTGLAFKLPFAKKPLAAAGKDYGLICNVCTCTTGISGRRFFQMLEQRIVPQEICQAIDRFFETEPDAPRAYGEGFAKWLVPQMEGDDAYLSTILAVYRRES